MEYRGVNMKIRVTLIAATSLAVPMFASTLAHAQPVTGPYISAGAGYNIELDQQLNSAQVGGVPLADQPKVANNNGIMGQAAVGYGFGGVRVELEGDYYNNSLSKNTSGNTPAGGRSIKYGAMLNAYYDFNFGWPVFPYICAGVGYQYRKYSNFNSVGLYANGGKSDVAGQVIVGAAYPIAAVPGLSVTGEYRFTAIGGARNFGDASIGNSFTAANDYNNSFLLGVRYQLFQPAPPPPPAAPMPVAAPAPGPAKTYLVFFDWDKYSLTPRALDIIAQAASDSKTQSTTTIAVNGYTDTSGTPVYNQGLSVRRAKAVAAQLVTDGVPASEITAQGFGDTDLLVPTGPGVREPQNRRVQIVLQ